MTLYLRRNLLHLGLINGYYSIAELKERLYL